MSKKRVYVDEFDECPHCGCDSYYTKEYVSGHVQVNARFDKGIPENTELYDWLTHKLESVYIYCANCNKKIAKIRQEDRF